MKNMNAIGTFVCAAYLLVATPLMLVTVAVIGVGLLLDDYGNRLFDRLMDGPRLDEVDRL